MLNQGAMMYKLSLSDEAHGQNLKDRIKMIIPSRRAYVTENVFSRIDKRFYRSNIIIHEANPISGLTYTQFDGLNFCIIFLRQNGDVDRDGDCIWVCGDMMFTLVSPTTDKPKYVLINRGSSWWMVQSYILSNFDSRMSEWEAKDKIWTIVTLYYNTIIRYWA